MTVVLLVLTDHRKTAHSMLCTAAVWLLDRVEHGSGIVRAGEPASAAVRQLLGPAYPHIRLGKEPAAYGLTVVLDLAHLCGFDDLYVDLLNDVDAVGAMASIVVERSSGDAEFVARLAYTEFSPVAVHHGVPERARLRVRRAPSSTASQPGPPPETGTFLPSWRFCCRPFRR